MLRVGTSSHRTDVLLRRRDNQKFSVCAQKKGHARTQGEGGYLQARKTALTRS